MLKLMRSVSVYVLHGAYLEGLFHCTEFFLTQNGTLVIKFDQLIFAILIREMNKRLATNSSCVGFFI